MASQNRIYKQQKLLGQVYTPRFIVDKILRETGYVDADLDSTTILDPACGDGRFLVQIVSHIIQNSAIDLLEKRLANVHGWDIDPAALEACRENLDTLTESLGVKITWNLHCLNALGQKKSRVKFDYIVGNPPYIRIQHLEAAQRKYIQNHYSFCKSGATDAYVAFFQLSSILLSEKGTCGFITPNSYFSSETGSTLRSYFETTRNLTHVTNYGSFQVFENATTYSAITIFAKQSNGSFLYEKCDNEATCTSREIPFSELRHNEKWLLSIEPPQSTRGPRLGDICSISVGLATLADAYYVFKIISEQGDDCYCISKNGREVLLERAALKPVIKGSRLKNSYDPIAEYILFPYQKDENGKHKIIPESALEIHFPKAHSYLMSIRDVLIRRDNGKPNPIAWYAFGRAQGLDTSFGKKIIFSPLALRPNFVLHENEDVTIYSGYYIKYDGDYTWLLKELNSERLAAYMAIAGRDFQGGYKGYNKKVLENFTLSFEKEKTSTPLFPADHAASHQ